MTTFDLLKDLFASILPFLAPAAFTMKKDKEVRVRMAPSPTGSLHIGTARTALFNFLFAKRQKGTLVLRMEDTDAERSTKESEKDILEHLAWLGITFDEGVMPDGSEKGSHGPYRQTARLELYKNALSRLLTEHKAYYCFCTKEELEAQRQSQQASGQAPRYSGKCRSVPTDEAQSRLSAGERAVIRLKVAPEQVRVHDLIRGDVVFDNALIGDIVIAKSLESPLYNFAVVVDDETMKITHVIRGDDHLANTPKQVVIAEALGVHPPKFAHLPVILSATGKGKMSKRDGGTTIKEYREAGYLPAAMLNFIALLGWHPAGDTELLPIETITSEFSLERVQKGGAKFDAEKLDHFNQQYLKRLPIGELADKILTGGFVPTEWGREQVTKVLPAVRERMVKLSDFKEAAGFFFALPEYQPQLLAWKKGSLQGARENLERCKEALSEIGAKEFTQEVVEQKVTALGAQYGNGEVFWPLRVAVSGKEASPPPGEIIAALGKQESLARITEAIKKLDPQKPLLG